MIFTDPVPFEEALAAQAARTVLPTELRTFMLSIIPAELRQRAFFSAGVMNAELLDSWNGRIGDVLSGKLSATEARVQMRQRLNDMGYAPPKAAQGGLLDLSSDLRLNLIIDTNVAQMNGYGNHVQGQDPDILDLWPAKELFRAIRAMEPRNWPSRWRNNGGRTYGGRMIARKNDSIWRRISRFGNPYPPFDFNSGMRTRDIEREEAEKLGVITAGEAAPEPEIPELNETLQSSPKVRSGALRSELEATGLGRFDDGGVFRYQRREEAPVT